MTELRIRFALRLKRIEEDQHALAQLTARGAMGAAPASHDLPGIAWLLAAVYNEIEELLKGVAAHFNESLPSTSTWHRDLLDVMVGSTKDRSAVLSEATKNALDEYRAFRHFSRNATFLVLDWDRMAPLVARLDEVVRRFRAEFEGFLQSGRL